jgi:hypothetical protein
MRAVVFIVLFALVFGFATLKSQSGGLGFGTHSFTSYGWPQRWLTVDHRTQTVSIHADGRREGGERWIEREIHWQQLAVSASVAAGIAAVLTVPFLFWPAKRTTKEYDPVAS